MSGSNPYAAEKAIQGGAAAPLTNEQKKRAVLIARRAFELLCERGILGDAAEFDIWRHSEIMQCVERGGLKLASQEDWPYIIGHFAAIVAKHTDMEQERHVFESMAARMGAKANTSDTSFALAKMRHECEAAADVLRDPRGFCAGISFKRFHAPPEKISAKQVWWLIFTLRRRAAQLRRKGRAA